MSKSNQDVNQPGLSSTPAADVPQVDSSTTTPAADTPAADASVPASSTGEGAKPEGAAPEVKSPLDVVRSVLKSGTADTAPKPDAPASQPDATTPKADAAAPAADGKLPPLTPEEEAKLPFHKHPRWQEMVGQRNEARERVTALEEPARQFGLVQEFMTKNQLTPPEMADGFTVMALMRNEPGKAIPILEDYLSQLKLITGATLPDDLQKQVDSGAMTEAAAKEVASSRLKAATAETQANRDREVSATNAEQNARTQNAAAVNAWEAQAKVKDPDFERKKPFIRDAMLARTNGRKVPTPAEAVQIAQAAYDAVNERFKGLTPTRSATPTPPQPRSGDSAAPGATNQGPPKTALDAVKRGLSAA